MEKTMAGVGSTQQSIRKALGVIKDSTTVGLAKVNSEYKDLDIAIVKATNHVEQLAKEKHLRTIFDAVSASRPRADVGYCVNALSRRLAKTHNWAVALKTLIVIHRALREVDPTFREELVNYTSARGFMLNLSHFKDDSSPNAWDYSAWVRTYALYLEERLECFRILKYDVEIEDSRTSKLHAGELLEQLPALQQLLFRLLGCQPEGAAVHNCIIKYALSLVAGESIKLYNAINGGTLNLVDKFFEMQRHDAVRALEIYRKAGSQAERLSEFYKICKCLEPGRCQMFAKIEQPPTSFIAAMEEYLKDVSRVPQLNLIGVSNEEDTAAQAILAIEHGNINDEHGEPEPGQTQPELPAAGTAEAPAQAPISDLLVLDDFNDNAAEMEGKNDLALAIVVDDNQPNSSDISISVNASVGWELALADPPSSNKNAISESKLAGGLDRLTLDSLYDDANTRRANPNGSYHLSQVAPNPFETYQYSQDPFYASNSIAPPVNVQMATIAQQQALMVQQQQQQLPITQDGTNPFGNPFGAAGAPSYPSQNPYTGLM